MRTATGIRFPDVERGWSWEVIRKDGLYSVYLIRPDGAAAGAELVTDIWGSDTRAPKKGDIARAARRLLAQREASKHRRHRETGAMKYVGRYGATVRVDEARLGAAFTTHAARTTDAGVSCSCGEFTDGTVAAFLDHRDAAVRAALETP